MRLVAARFTEEYLWVVQKSCTWWKREYGSSRVSVIWCNHAIQVLGYWFRKHTGELIDFREPVLCRSLRIALQSCFERNTGPGSTWGDFMCETRGYIVVSTRTLCKAMKTWLEANVSDTRTWKNLFAYSWRENCLKFTDSTTMPLPRPLWDTHMTWSSFQEAKIIACASSTYLFHYRRFWQVVRRGLTRKTVRSNR